jgi:hypothetical protein
MTVTGEESSLGTDQFDPPLMAPLRRDLTWQHVQRMSQSAEFRDDPLLRRIRATATIRRGTRMIKILSPEQVAGHLGGWSPYGFCYRSSDLEHFRSPAELALLRTDGETNPEVAYALRWRAVDSIDYEVPGAPAQPGLATLPNHARVGGMVLGTGFTPSTEELIPEFVTAGFADLPMPANAKILAYTGDGQETVLYSYQPEQHAWLRLAGPRSRHLLAELPGVSPDREFLPCTDAPSAKLVGRINNHEYDAIADPPDEFRVRALTRAARYPVQTLSRRAERALWRRVPGWVLQRDDRWARLRIIQPDSDALNATGARCYERGVYESWAPLAELDNHHITDIPYEL